MSKKRLVAAAKFLVAATKKIFVVPNFVAVTKPFFPVLMQSAVRGWISSLSFVVENISYSNYIIRVIIWYKNIAIVFVCSPSHLFQTPTRYWLYLRIVRGLLYARLYGILIFPGAQVFSPLPPNAKCIFLQWFALDCTVRSLYMSSGINSPRPSNANRTSAETAHSITQTRPPQKVIV